MTSLASATSAAHTGPRRPVRIVLTPLGWVCLALVPAMASSLFWLEEPTGLHLAIAIAAAFLWSHLYAVRCVRRVEGRWLLPQSVHAGETATIGALISSRSGTGPMTICVAEHQAGSGGELARVSGLGGAPTRLAWATRFERRGLNRLPPLEAACMRPFGFLTACMGISGGDDLLVLPALGRLRSRPLAELQQWLDSGFHAEDPGNDELAHLRDYRHGDSRRRIHWRATARAGRLLVTERHSPQAHQIAIVVDNRAPDRRSRRFERLIAAVATVVDHFCHHHWQVTLLGPWAPKGGLVGDRERLLEGLALIPSQPRADLGASLPRRVPCLVFTLHSDMQPPAGTTCRIVDLTTAEELVALGRQVR